MVYYPITLSSCQTIIDVRIGEKELCLNWSIYTCGASSLPAAYQQHTTLHTTAGLLLKLSRVGPGQFLDGRPDASGSGVGGPVGGTLSGLKKYPMPQGSDWGHCPV